MSAFHTYHGQVTLLQTERLWQRSSNPKTTISKSAQKGGFISTPTIDESVSNKEAGVEPCEQEYSVIEIGI